MTDLTKLANGEMCTIRVPGYCTWGPETVVACHLRMVNVSGAGTKALDLLIAFGCQACHDVVDGRQKTTFTRDARRLMLLEGVARTQVILVSREVITW